MVAVGVITLGASVYYSFTRLQPLEDEIAKKRGEVAELNAQAVDAQRLVDQAKQEHAALKQNIEQLYAVRVTGSNTVYRGQVHREGDRVATLLPGPNTNSPFSSMLPRKCCKQ